MIPELIPLKQTTHMFNMNERQKQYGEIAILFEFSYYAIKRILENLK